MRHTYGSGAHARVLAYLPAEQAARLDGDVREASWQRIEDLVAYMEAARALLAPDDGSFHRRLGRFAGELDRRQRAVSVMVRDVPTAAAMAQTVFRSYFEVGRLEVAGIDPLGAVLRFHDFPMTEAWCQRTQGALEGLLSNEELEIRVSEGECLARGGGFCEYRLSFAQR